MDDLVFRPALELSSLLKSRQISVTELLSACERNIALRNGRLQAFVTVTSKAARKTASVMERTLRQEDPQKLPPFFGVPLGIKDINLLRGVPAKMGSAAFRWLVSPMDDLSVKALRKGGFVFLGKTATSELAILPMVETEIHPPTRNPHDEERTAGGSSGGAAAAVAGGLLPIAHASDGGGSIRIPASFCGLVGHKSTAGLIPNPYARVDRLGLAVSGSVARTVEDAAAFLDVLRGVSPDSADSLLSRSKRDVGKLRVQICTRPPIGVTDPQVAAVALAAARRLESMGHSVSEGAEMRGSLEEFLPIYQRMAADAPVWVLEQRLQPITRWLRKEGKRHAHKTTAAIRKNLADRVLAWFGDVDVAVTPTVPVLPPQVHAYSHLPPEEGFAKAAVLGAFTALCNLSGQPAISVPLGRVAGVPVGVQLIGKPGSDGLLLALARLLLAEEHKQGPGE